MVYQTWLIYHSFFFFLQSPKREKKGRKLESDLIYPFPPFKDFTLDKTNKKRGFMNLNDYERFKDSNASFSKGKKF